MGDGRERSGTMPGMGGLYCELLVTACVNQGLDEVKENADCILCEEGSINRKGK